MNYVEKITFCGNDGDPIYAHEFAEIIDYIKSIKPVTMIIVTNGSHKKTTWWESLAKSLSFPDQIHFSLDGWDQESNEKYRVNSDFASVINGIETVRKNSDCWMIWDAIGFEFNQNEIDVMRDMADKLGFDQFQLTKSTKFGKMNPNVYGLVDPLQPKDSLMSSSKRFEREIQQLSERTLTEPWMETNIKFYNKAEIIADNIKPLCHIGNKGLFINSQGDFYPCSWVANRYAHNAYWIEIGKRFNLFNNDLIAVVNDNIWQSDFIQDSIECRSKCGAQQVSMDYALAW